MNENRVNDNADAVRAAVREGYSKIAVGTAQGCCGPNVSCCSSAPAEANKLAQHIGYSAEELAALPEGANMGLSCGNPAAPAALKPGEVVLDLGAGGGFDVFIAGRKVGPTGRAIGVDMTPDMLAKARRNIATYRERSGLNNVEFRLGEIEHLPVADNSVDAIISNCVINLSPDKPQVWREIARVLRPGGRVAVSDLALLQPLPGSVREMIEALVGCVAGAALVSETERMVASAGLTDIGLNQKPGYVEAMTTWEDPLYQKILAQLPAGTKPSDFITSLEVTARKPGGVANNSPITMTKTTPVLEIFDPAMCCSTGVCGPSVDPKLAQFAADLDWLRAHGVRVQRHNLAQSPAAFAGNALVKAALEKQGTDCLPLVIMNGAVASSARYPSRDELSALTGVALAKPMPIKLASAGGGCGCSSGGCC